MLNKIFLLLLIPSIVFADRLHPEKHYQAIWCNANGGIIEYILPDKTRVDCLTEKYAIEVDFASKWAESIGQSLHYAAMTGKEPGIIIIMENPEKDWKHLPKLFDAIIESGRKIKVWVVNLE